MQTEYSSDKNTRNLLFKRIINEATYIDNRSEFDKNINVAEFRERYFSSDSTYVKNNPGYRIRTEQLRTNEDAVELIRNDLHRSLIKEIPVAQLEAADNSCNIHHFSHYNALGENFIVETQMLIANNKDENGNTVMALGYGFMYLADSITGNKLFIGTIKIRKDKTDPKFYLNASMVYGLFTDIVKHLDSGKIISFFVDKSFAGLRHTLLKKATGYRVNIKAIKVGKDGGYKAQQQMIVADLKSLSNSFIDVIQLTDVRKLLY